MSWNPRLFVLALAGALALAAGALGCGKSEGSPGSENPGGGGGSEPCGGAACLSGTICNEESGRCECTSSPNSCAIIGRVCSAAGICIEKPADPVEFESCSEPGSESADGQLRCLPYDDVTNVWVRPCEQNSQCVLNDTVCLHEATGGELPFCWYNLCGESAVETEGGEAVIREGEFVYLNGRNWGSCDTSTGRSASASSSTGTCLPFEGGSRTIFFCKAAGEQEVGEPCRGDLRDSPDLCRQGAFCLARAISGAECRGDGECGAGEVCEARRCVARSCRSDAICGPGYHCDGGSCQPDGRCVDPCNGGNLLAEGGDFAGCSSDHPFQHPSPVCAAGLSSSVLGRDHALAWCRSSCDVFSANPCNLAEGDNRICAAAPTPRDPLSGTCEEIGDAEFVDVGKPCGYSSVSCHGGDVCLPFDGGGTRYLASELGKTELAGCQRLCECTGAGGWKADGTCKTSSPQCTGQSVCAMAFPNNDRLGACLGALAAPAESEL